MNVNGQAVTWDTANIPTNYNDCPNNGTAPIPPNGVVFVQNAKSTPVTGANPFDNYINNSVTNLTASPTSPVAGQPVTLTRHGHLGQQPDPHRGHRLVQPDHPQRSGSTRPR